MRNARSLARHGLSLEDMLAIVAGEIVVPGTAVAEEAPLWAPLPLQPGDMTYTLGDGSEVPRPVYRLDDGTAVSPQAYALASPADELLFGGAPGAGKSDLLLGAALTQHRNSIIFRRLFRSLRGAQGIVERSREIIGLRGGLNESLFTWHGLPGGRALQFAGCDRWDDILKYKGLPHDLKCVGRDTPVWMADGSTKPVQDVRVGDMVDTLEGPCVVTRTMTVRRPAVRLELLLRDGQVWTQTQGADHRVLADGAWVDHDTLSGVRQDPPAVSSSTVSLGVGRWQGWSRPRCASLVRGTLGLLCHFALPRVSWLGLAGQGWPDLSGCVAVAGAPVRGTGFGASGCSRRDAWRRSLSIGARALIGPSPRSAWLGSGLRGLWNVGVDGRHTASRGDSPADCRSGSRSCDAQPRLWPAVVLVDPRLRADAGGRTPNGCGPDVPVGTRRHSRPWLRFAHPYTREPRRTLRRWALVAARSFAVGECELHDLTVASSRHYITGPGLVNRNCFDELAEFSERAYRTLIGWLRTVTVGQRQRVIAGSNPPITEEGQWIIRYWGPWLDPNHAHPAKPGELRWFVIDERGADREVDGPTGGCERAQPVKVGQRWIVPRSRTFVPGRAEDNPYLVATGYLEVLDSMPEPLRSQMRFGNFSAAVEDHPQQVIPSAWVAAAQARWRSDGGAGLPLSAAGVDPSRGGEDEFVIAPRYDAWLAPLVVHPAKAAPDGQAGAQLVWDAIAGDVTVPVQVDIIGTAGGAVHDFARALGLRAVALNGSEKTKARTRPARNPRGEADRRSTLPFANKRALWHWRLREALDPVFGDNLALPPDPQLRADLCAPRFTMTLRGIQIEEKEAIRARLGRSPDRGEAVIYACAEADETGAFELLFAGGQPGETAVDELARVRQELGLGGGNGNGAIR